MGFRFRKRIRLGKGVWINLSKKGGSLSFGGRGATMNVSKKGVRDTFQRARAPDQLSDEASRRKRMFGVVGDVPCSNRCRFISVEANNMSDNSASNKWIDLFCRTTDSGMVPPGSQF